MSAKCVGFQWIGFTWERKKVVIKFLAEKSLFSIREEFYFTKVINESWQNNENTVWHFSVLGSNHYGIAGYYSMQALKENMIVSKRFICLLYIQKTKCPFFLGMEVNLILCLLTIWPPQGMSFTNTSPLVVPTRGKEVNVQNKLYFMP